VGFSPPHPSKERKQFFFEKTNQKTFTGCVHHPSLPVEQMPDAMSKSVLLPFFKKEASSFNGTP
jgi:hypothetical protein